MLPLRRAGLALSSSRGRRAVRRVGEAAHALHGYAAVLVLPTGLDLLLARHVLGSEQAAQYAAGSVVTLAQWGTGCRSRSV